MALDPQQDKRAAVLSTPLGKDVLSLTGFDASEGLSEDFEFTINCVGKKDQVDFNGAVGENASVTIHGKNASRTFNGVMVGADWIGESDSGKLYRLTLRPWFWLLTKTNNCRIFHDKTTREIIEEVLGEHSFADFQFKLSESYPPRHYCVQYRESDHDFICRLMEEDGIYYYFEHSAGGHKMIMADSPSAHSAVPGLEKIFFIDRLVSKRSDQESFYDLTSSRSFQTGKIALTDYDYEKPSAQMKTNAQGTASYANSSLEAFDFPGRYTEPNDGERFANVRLEAQQAADERRVASGDAPALFPGGLFTLQNHPDDSQNQKYLVVRALHTFSGQEYRAGSAGGDDYTGTYELQASDKPFRAPRVTPKPVVQGPQTAKVVGAQGEEIDVDELGRILVQFHWDRDGSRSRRVRVAQTWSGQQWGSIMIPRIGQEVVVEHLEGDPDQPLVIGTVYNAERQVPYDLPANKTKGGVKSNSTTGGGGYNEIVCEEKSGQEERGIHGEYELSSGV
ncbi:MAG: type VI secretion system tip protein TssI/VgrG, partial [Pseudomonadota bacterium]